MRISTTAIESFRLWEQPDQDWMSEESLIATIRGEFTPTPAILLGRAFGAVLEMPDPYQVPEGYRCDGYFFSDAVMRPALELMDRRGVFEAKATKEYGPHTVVAKADQIVGARLIEHKTTLSTFDFDKYAKSAQWRFMVDLFAPLVVTYHVFCLSESARDGAIELRSVESFNLFPYAGLHQDCCELLERFVEFVTARGLEGFLTERKRAA